MRRMIPQKLINAIKALLPFSNKISYVGDQVKVNADVEVEGLTSKGIANTGTLANIGDGAFTGAVTAKTLEQSEPNESLSFDQFSCSSVDVEVVYGKFEVFNNILYIVGILKYTNNTDASVNIGNSSYQQFDLSSLSANEKIYDILGKKLSETPDPTFTPIASADIYMQRTGTNINSGLLSRYTCAYFHSAKDKFYINPRDLGAIASGESLYANFRIALTLR